MSGTRPKRLRYVAPPNERAQRVLKALMADRGWTAKDVENASTRPGSGHPTRFASESTIRRVITRGHTPEPASQFEIAAVFRYGDGKHLLPSHIWGTVPLPEPYAYLNDMAVTA